MIHARGRFALVLAVLAVLFCLGTVPGCSAPTPGAALPTTEDGIAERRDAAVRVAEQTAVALISLDHRDPERGYDRLLGLLTDPARTQWEQRRAAYLAPLTSSNTVSSEATVQESGVAALEPGATAVTVLVAATATVSTAESAVPEERRYRLQMSAVPTPDGWKVSELQIVE